MQNFNSTRCLLLSDGFRKEGSMMKDDKEITWAAGYVLKCLLLGGNKGTDVRNFVVRSDLEDTIKAQLAKVNWGSVIDLELEDKQVVSVSVVLDWLDQISLI